MQNMQNPLKGKVFLLENLGKIALSLNVFQFVTSDLQSLSPKREAASFHPSSLLHTLLVCRFFFFFCYPILQPDIFVKKMLSFH